MRRKPVKRRRSRLGARPTTSENAEGSFGEPEPTSEDSAWGSGIVPEAPEKKQGSDSRSETDRASEKARSSRGRGAKDEAPSRESKPDRRPTRESKPRESKPRSDDSASRRQRPHREKTRPSERSPRKESGPRKESARSSAKSGLDTLSTRDRRDVELKDEQLRALLFSMLRIRTIDQRMLKLQRQGRISFYGTASGQEAAVAGSAHALRPTDWIVPALREGGAMLIRGWPLERYVAQCFGTVADVTKGRQMPSHYADREVRVVSWSSCIGTQLPHATGMAWAARIRGHSDVVMAYMGDGATSEGDFHTALNFAGVAKAPVVFLCQNNQWAISIPSRGQTASETIAIKAEAYGFPGIRVDGNDVLQVFEACRDAVRRAREGKGPTLIEALTYRMGAHSTSDDPTKYRDPREVEEWAAKDPIERYRRFLNENQLWNEDEEREFVEELEEELQEVIRRVEDQPAPPLESLFEDVYSEVPSHLKEQAEQLLGRPWGETVTSEKKGRRPQGKSASSRGRSRSADRSDTRGSGRRSDTRSSGRGSDTRSSGRGSDTRSSVRGSDTRSSGRGSDTRSSGRGSDTRSSGRSSQDRRRDPRRSREESRDERRSGGSREREDRRGEASSRRENRDQDRDRGRDRPRASEERDRSRETKSEQSRQTTRRESPRDQDRGDRRRREDRRPEPSREPRPTQEPRRTPKSQESEPPKPKPSDEFGFGAPDPAHSDKEPKTVRRRKPRTRRR